MLDKRLSFEEELVFRLRTGQVSVDAVKQAASIGFPPAKALFPNISQDVLVGVCISWEEIRERVTFFDTVDLEALLNYLLWCGEKCLPLYKRHFELDHRLQNGINEARQCIAAQKLSDYTNTALRHCYEAHEDAIDYHAYNSFDHDPHEKRDAALAANIVAHCLMACQYLFADDLHTIPHYFCPSDIAHLCHKSTELMAQVFKNENGMWLRDAFAKILLGAKP